MTWPDASIDFAEWDKALVDLNAERSQHLAAERLKGSLAELERKQDARLTPGGKLPCWRPMIDEAPGPMAAALDSRQQFFSASCSSADGELTVCESRTVRR